MLAKASVQAESPNVELLNASHSLMRQASSAQILNGGVGPHNDGCGVAWLADNRIHLERRGADTVWDSSFQELIKSISTTALIAHNRKASRGLEINMKMSHPYLIEYESETIAFCHNGEISDFMEEAQDRKIADSLVFLERLTQKIGSLTLDELKRVLTESADTLNFSSINALLLTKDSVFAWRCYQETKSAVERDRYFSLYLRERPGQICIASEPVDDDPHWISLPNRTLLQVHRSDDVVECEQIRF
jgi:glutamine amidotransferase